MATIKFSAATSFCFSSFPRTVLTHWVIYSAARAHSSALYAVEARCYPTTIFLHYFQQTLESLLCSGCFDVLLSRRLSLGPSSMILTHHPLHLQSHSCSPANLRLLVICNSNPKRTFPSHHPLCSEENPKVHEPGHRLQPQSS